VRCALSHYNKEQKQQSFYENDVAELAPGLEQADKKLGQNPTRTLGKPGRAHEIDVVLARKQ